MLDLLAIVYLCLFLAAGYLLARLVFHSERPLIRLWLGGVCGLFLLIWLPALCSFLFGFTVLFALVTLPVEFNASRRAFAGMTQAGVLYESELPAAKSVLNAAAMTYVASALTAILQLVRLLAIANNGRRRD